MEIEKIKPYQKNAKKHPEKQIKQIAESIKAFGFNQPIVIDKNNEIIVGHGRYEAAKLLGLIDVPIIRADQLTEEQIKAYRLADNKLNESEWDMALAIEELKGLNDEMFDLTGFDRDLLIEPDEKDDVIPENVPPVAKLGDVWALGNHRVMCGDSTKKEDVEKLMDGKKAAFAMSDPPYNVSYEGGSSNKEKREDSYKDKWTDEQYTTFLQNVLEGAYLATDEQAPLHLWFSASELKSVVDGTINAKWQIRNILIWNKTNAHYGALGARYKEKKEPLLYCVKGKTKSRWFGKSNETTVWDCEQPHSNKLHPTMKPVALYVKSILNHTESDNIVYESFSGSGTTLIAAEKTGRICYGMELDPKYVDVIVQRYVDYTGNENIIKNGENVVWRKSADQPS